MSRTHGATGAASSGDWARRWPSSRTRASQCFTVGSSVMAWAQGAQPSRSQKPK